MDAVSSEDSSTATSPTIDTSDKQTTTALDRVRVRDFLGWMVGILLLPATGVKLLFPSLFSDLIGRAAVLVAVGVWIGQAVWRHGLNLAAVFGPLPDLHGWGLTMAAVAMIDLSGSAQLHLLVPWLEQVAPTLADWYTMSSASSPSGPTDFLYLIASGVLIAPLLEEFILRGFLYQRWAHSWNRPVWALGTSAGLFAVMHGHVLGVFVFSVVTTLLYVHTRSLWAPIVMHAACNLIAIPGVLPVRSGFEAATGVTDAQTFGLACLAVSTPLLVWFVVQYWEALFDPLPYLEHSPPSS